jgi:hypothetical protein
MVERKKGKSTGRQVADEAFRRRLDDSRLLLAIDNIYKKEYGCSARKYLLTEIGRAHV